MRGGRKRRTKDNRVNGEWIWVEMVKREKERSEVVY